MGRAEDLFGRARTEGYDFIRRLIETGQSEELYIDYKRAGKNGAGEGLDVSDRKNFARAVSGFANSAGGIVIWGVDCRDSPGRGDVPVKEVPIENPGRFLSWLEGATSGVTLPPHPGVIHQALQHPHHHGNGFVISLIPESGLLPHAALVKNEAQICYIRVGSNFEPVPLAVLAGMFGKRPTPSIHHAFGIGKDLEGRLPGQMLSFDVSFMLINTGVTITRDLFLNLVFQLPDGQWDVTIWPGDHEKRWDVINPAFGTAAYFVTTDQFKLAPGAQIHVGTFRVSFNGQIDRDWSFKMQYGCDGAPITSLERIVPAEQLKEAISKFQEPKDGKFENRLARFLIRPD